jgi:branched-chain amino acid transport system ATP-binding protein
MLRIDGLSAGYGEASVLREVSLSIPDGEIVTLCGRNGAGKTTLLRCVMGLNPYSGSVVLGERDLRRDPPFKRARLGLGWVPDDRGAYASLTVQECLRLPVSSGGWSVERVYETFPNLHARRDSLSTKLSGGEQQMLALARVLRMGAKVLLCDEPTEGLSPVLVEQVGEILRQARTLGVSVLLVEQNLHFAGALADRCYVLASGQVRETAPDDKDLLTYLGV